MKNSSNRFSNWLTPAGSLFKQLPTLLLVLALLMARTLSAQTGQHTLLALSKNDHTLAIVDAKTLKVIAKVPVGPDPHEVVSSEDGKFAYVSNTGGGRSTEINVIDLVSQKALPNIDTRPLIGPHGLMFAAGKLWFSAEGSKAVGRIDPATGKLDWVMGTGQERTHMVYVTTNGKKVYTTNVNAGTVSLLIDSLMPPMQPMGPPPGGQPPMPGPGPGGPRREWIQTVVPVGKGAEGFDVTPDGRQLWTAAANDGTIAVVDLATAKPAFVIDAKVMGANRLKFTPDGKLALVSSLRTGDLFVFDVATQKEIKRIHFGRGGAGILVDNDGTRAFVGCTPDNFVAVIDLKTLTLTGTIDVGGGPDGLAWAVRQ